MTTGDPRIEIGEAMSHMRFVGNLVVYEADLHDIGSRARSLGLPN